MQADAPVRLRTAEECGKPRLAEPALLLFFFFFQAEDGIRDHCVTGVQTCALPICGQRSEQIALVHHRDSPFGNVFRKVAMPSAAALLAASSLPPTISATCR